MDTFERKQHFNFPCAISCQGTFIIEFHWWSNNRWLFHITFLFIASPHSSQDNVLSLMHRLTVVGLLLAFFYKNVRKISRRRVVPSTLTAFKWIMWINNFIISWKTNCALACYLTRYGYFTGRIKSRYTLLEWD